MKLLVCELAVAVGLQQPQPLLPRPALKLIVEHPALAPYLDPQNAGRVPLVVSDHLLEPGVTPSRFGQPLRIVPDREAGRKAHLRILSFDVDGSRAKAVVEYQVEGVQAVFGLRRDSKGWWTVVDAKVTTHGRVRKNEPQCVATPKAPTSSRSSAFHSSRALNPPGGRRQA